jgi:hypothetical protein
MNDSGELGYSWLVRRYALPVCDLLAQSFATKQSTKRVVKSGAVEETHYPLQRHRIRFSWQEQLAFALKHEGVNVEILRALFRVVSPEEIAAFVAEHPLGNVRRRLWFLYEFLTERKLDLPDGQGGGYVPLVDGKLQYALPLRNARRSRRHHVLDNLIGNRAFSPFVRKTEIPPPLECGSLRRETEVLLENYSAELVYRAVQYLFVKETKSSFALERESPDQRRTAAFVEILRQAGEASLEKESLLDIQNRVVDARYAQRDWRSDQVYVGETVSPTREKVHFIAPRPDAIDELMRGWLDCLSQWLASDEPDAIVIAAVMSFAFVFLHPFDDGNGRTHRYLMHAILSKRGFAPRGLIFPVSAVMLKNRLAYDEALETFSVRLMRVLDYDMDGNGEITVPGDTRDLYRAIDFTPIVAYFRGTVEETIRTEWKAELDFLASYDKMRVAMRAIVDMPEKKANLFIRLALQNGGRLAIGKRKMFSELSETEIAALENAVSACMPLAPANDGRRDQSSSGESGHEI